MSGIKKIQKEDIINATLDIVRESGLEDVQARNIAAKLNCSTQPIFYQFTNMDELKKVLFDKIIEIYRSYLEVDETDLHPYKNMGIGYIKFAKEEPKLFQIVFMSHSNLTEKNFMKHDEKVYKWILRNVEAVTGISSKNNISNLHLKMWIFTHGIASLIATKTCEFSDEQISEMLTDEFKALMMLEKMKGEEKN